MNLLLIMQTARLVADAVPEVVQYVEGVDDPTVNTSDAKKDLAMRMLKALYEAKTPAIPFADIISIVSATVDGVVSLYHAAGKFVKTGTGSAMANAA